MTGVLKVLVPGVGWVPSGGAGPPGAGSAPIDAWPVGSVFISVTPTNPATLLGGGTWVSFATGRMLIGIDPSDAAMDAAEEVGGEKAHTIDLSEVPNHQHGMSHTHPMPHTHELAHTHTITHDHANATTSSDSHSHTFAALNGATAFGSSNIPRGNASGTTATSFPTSSDAHTHTVDIPTFTGSSGAASETTTGSPSIANTSATGTTLTGGIGGGVAMPMLPPYIVTYMWKRTA